jgi:hypothetical protein
MEKPRACDSEWLWIIALAREPMSRQTDRDGVTPESGADFILPGRPPRRLRDESHWIEWTWASGLVEEPARVEIDNRAPTRCVNQQSSRIVLGRAQFEFIQHEAARGCAQGEAI